MSGDHNILITSPDSNSIDFSIGLFNILLIEKFEDATQHLQWRGNTSECHFFFFIQDEIILNKMMTI
ncbi:hypothetical protein N425_11025 [Tannerella sp. oral taxon BU063 isolate Cell 2]|uniref:Uncharacterized protein n=1 Tax=Tannerella sp. oral taxon BU063 isolate Cell 2 TaxID=1411148 RepID=W2C2G7_9BACT|nr:hypothetical protein N425_11025 [Tannerella sp. oral taxon BU063 isolate Cell 2]